jgi:hypothetical protein
MNSWLPKILEQKFTTSTAPAAGIGTAPRTPMARVLGMWASGEEYSACLPVGRDSSALREPSFNRGPAAAQNLNFVFLHVVVQPINHGGGNEHAADDHIAKDIVPLKYAAGCLYDDEARYERGYTARNLLDGSVDAHERASIWQRGDGGDQCGRRNHARVDASKQNHVEHHANPQWCDAQTCINGYHNDADHRADGKELKLANGVAEFANEWPHGNTENTRDQVKVR